MFDSFSKRVKDVKISYIHLDLLVARTARNVFYVTLRYES
jgi:hypothetical protein